MALGQVIIYQTVFPADEYAGNAHIESAVPRIK